jgi:hypothetical protein
VKLQELLFGGANGGRAGGPVLGTGLPMPMGSSDVKWPNALGE